MSPCAPPTRPFASQFAAVQEGVRGARTARDWQLRKSYQVRCDACRRMLRTSLGVLAPAPADAHAASRGPRPLTARHAGGPRRRRLGRAQWLVALGAGLATGVLAFVMNYATEALQWGRYYLTERHIDANGGRRTAPRPLRTSAAFGPSSCAAGQSRAAAWPTLGRLSIWKTTA